MTTEVAPPLAAGRLKLREVLGEGGVGTVYLAYDERLDVERAVKVLSKERASNQVQRQRFLTEARIQARLRHPNIVEVYDIEDDGTQVYLVMELVAGGSLWDRLKAEGPIPPAEAARVAAGILAALEEAHALDIVHRDIKPHNILMTDAGVGKLADFGVAHLPSEEHAGVTRTGVVMGTWSFMAPEQRASSRRVDPRSDVYAVAATLYTLVTGYTEPDLFDFELDSPIMERLPEVLRPVVHRATRYSRSQRYQDARSMREDLERCAPALEGRAASPWPAVHPTDVPNAANHLARGRSPVATTQDRLPEDSDREVRSGTLVPTPAEVERLLATPSARTGGATYSDDGHTVELQPGAHGRPDLDTAEGKVELPIGAGPDEPTPEAGAGIGWTIDDERQLTEEEAHRDDLDELDDEPVHATWRSAGRLRFLLFLLLLAVGSAVAVAHQQGWIVLPQSLDEVFPGFSAVAPPSERPSEPVASSPPEPAAPDPVVSPPPRPDPVPTPTEEAVPAPAPGPAPDPGAAPEEVPGSDPEPPNEPEPAAPSEPEQTPEPVTTFKGLVMGESSEDEVLGRILMLNEHQVWDCYHNALLTNPSLEGRLEMHWHVSEGRVVSPKPISSPMGHQDLGRCVAAAAAEWEYPPWFSNMPRIFPWQLDPVKQTGRLIDQRQNELLDCGRGFSEEQIARFGKGQLDVIVEDGWVRSAIVIRGFEDEQLRTCLHDTAMEWRLPRYARGKYFLDLTMVAEVLGD